MDVSENVDKKPPGPHTILPNSEEITHVVESQNKPAGSTPPPPYVEMEEKSGKSATTASVNQEDSNSTVASAYKIPTDLSEGLSNPVFSYTSTSDEDLKNCYNRNVTLSTPQKSNTLNNNNCSKPILPLPTAPAFKSVNSCEHYTSQAALYISNNNSDFDTEKGPPAQPKQISVSTSKDDEAKKGTTEYKGFKRYLGLLLTLSASFSFSLVVLFVKVLKDYDVDAYGASFWRYTGTIIPTIPLLFFYECGPGVKKQESVFTGVWPIIKNDNWKTWLGLLVE